tara:strand:- start:825 stop:1376 length:552 start_codon:yes stop_codon:yes gene_type:complete
MKKNFYSNYFGVIEKLLKNIDQFKLNRLEKLILSTKKKKAKILIFGNGGSAATASHFAVDMTKNGGIKTLTLNEYDLITCFANDFGYENWIQKSIEYYYDKNDLVIFLSCSGNSENIVRGCKYAKKIGLKTVTLTGFDKKNKTNLIKSDLNIWINNKVYNIVEIVHFSILLSVIDKIITSKLK